jgi:hypothetical protein
VVELGEVELPDYGLPATEPSVPAITYQARVSAAARAAAEAGLDALLVYGDREHFANICYLTRFDPRFEEALLILVPGRKPTLLVGNEREAYARIAAIDIDVVRYQSFSLVNQPRSASPRLAGLLRAAGLGPGQATRLGIAGWKYFGPDEADRPEEWIAAPAFLVDELRALGCHPTNASAIFVKPGRGLRTVSDVDQLACFEFAAGTAYHTTNIEDGIALADEATRAELATNYPDLWRRVSMRRAFMADVLGIQLKPEVLPLSNLAGYLPPFWLSPGLAMRRC